MNCPRCHSVMVEERFQDFNDDTGRMHFFGYRCLSCGEILDPVIAGNRNHGPTPRFGAEEGTLKKSPLENRNPVKRAQIV